MIKRITTLVSAGRHPISGASRHCHNDSIAMMLGLNMAQSCLSEHRVLHAGKAESEALNDYLALGAGQIDVIPTADNADIVDCLMAELKEVDLILTGSRAESGQDSGLLPYLLAQKLAVPLVAQALSMKQNGDMIEVMQFLPHGERRQVAVKWPAIIAIHPLAKARLNFSYAKQVSGEIKLLPAPQSSAPLVNQHQSTHDYPSAGYSLTKLKAPENKTAYERMLASISSQSKGGSVVINGNSVEKAQVILDYLRKHRLAEF